MSSLETFYWFSWISWNVYIFSISAWHGAVLRHQPLHPNSWKEVEKAGEEVPGGTVSKHTAIQHLCFASLFQPFQLFQLNLKALCGYHWYHWHSHLQFLPAKCHLSWPSTPQICQIQGMVPFERPQGAEWKIVRTWIVHSFSMYPPSISKLRGGLVAFCPVFCWVTSLCFKTTFTA